MDPAINPSMIPLFLIVSLCWRSRDTDLWSGGVVWPFPSRGPSSPSPTASNPAKKILREIEKSKKSERVSQGRALDLPVCFGDASNREVLHKVGAKRACVAVITLDTPGASYRTIWALNKYFPNVKTFVRAHDVDHGLNLGKAGATAVVPETLEPSLQLAAAVLAQAKLPMSEITATINEFRTCHLSEPTELCQISGSSLGYGFFRVMSKPKIDSDSEDNEIADGTLAI